MHNQTPASAAAKEAFEEAGVSGDSMDLCLGVYIYSKPQKVGNAPIVTMVYPLHVTHVHSKWPEKHQRRRKWLSPAKAAKKLTEPQLKRIVAGFKPKNIGR